MNDQPDFTVVGSGLAGALMTCFLARAGHRVDLYEKRPDPRGKDQERGRSINLAISVRGIAALREVGIADQVLQTAIPMRGRMIHARDGSLNLQPYGKDDNEAIHSVSRGGLNVMLLNAAADFPNVRMHFHHKCLSVDLPSATPELLHEPTQQVTRVPANVLIGADGAFSAVRGQMQKLDRFNFRQDYLEHGYKELTMPPADGGGWRMEKHALHIWPRGTFMMIALPNLDGSFTCTLFWPYEGPNSFEALKTREDILRFFRAEFPDALELMPSLPDDFLHNPLGGLATVRCFPWHFRDKVVLLGDACHAVVPFFGQGMNAAFEDCSVLNRTLGACAPNWERAFLEYERARKKNVDVLADLCIRNFIEMRDRVNSRAFLFKKKTDLLLNRVFPNWYIPLYTFVSFTTTPYAEAVKHVRAQERIACVVFCIVLLLAVSLIVWLIEMFP